MQYSAVSASEENVYYGGRLVAKRLLSQSISFGTVSDFTADRLQSKGDGSRFYPYGESKTGAAGDDREQFATYTRDEKSGLDYADQRWYASSIARFTSSDPYVSTGAINDPQSWNRHSYVGNDSLSFVDPEGLARCSVFFYDTGIDVTCTSDTTGLTASDTLRNPPPGSQLFYFQARLQSLEERVDRGIPGQILRRFTDALERAIEALNDPYQCQPLFAKGEGLFANPGEVLRQLVSYGGLGLAGSATVVRSIGNIDGKEVAGRTKGSGTGQLSNRSGTEGFIYSTVHIYLSESFWWNTGDSRQDDWNNARVLVHELGHYYNLLGAAPGSAFEWDLDPGAQERNFTRDGCVTIRLN